MPAELPEGRWQTVTSVAPTSLSSIPVPIPIPRANKPSAIGHELKYFYDLFKYLNIYDGKYEIGTTPAILRFPPPPTPYSPLSLSRSANFSTRVTFVQKFPFNLVQFSLSLITKASQTIRAIRSDFYSLINLLQFKVLHCAPPANGLFIYAPHDI